MSMRYSAVICLLTAGCLWLNGAPAEELFHESRRIETPPARLQNILDRQREKGFTTDYIEMKHLRLLKRPLRSAGVITLAPEAGVYRRMTEPFLQELLIGEKRMLQRDEGEAITDVPAAKDPAVRAFVRAFVSLFSGSWSELKRNFEVYHLPTETGWTIGLRPRDAKMRQVISGLVMEGKAEQLLLLRVEERRGDRTEMRFTGERKLTPAEQSARDEMLAWKRKR